MGFLVDFAIRKFENVGNDIHRFGQAIGFMPVVWRDVIMMDKTRDGVMWRIPDPKVPSAHSLLGTKAILVAENELVIVQRDGKLDDENHAILPPGLYDVRNLTALRGNIFVTWCTTGEFKLRWGNGSMLTAEGRAVGAFGTYQVRVVNPVNFLRAVAKNFQVYSEEQLEDLTSPEVSSEIAGIFENAGIRELRSKKAEIQLACKEALMPSFERWGLEFLGLTIGQIKWPDGYLDALQAEDNVNLRMRARVAEERAGIELAQLEAQQEQYRILTEASRIRALGNANTEVMQNQLNIGINPLELEKIKAIEILAANPGEGMLTDNRPQIVNQLLPQPQVPPVGPVIVTGNPFVPAMPQQQFNQAGALPAPVNATPAATGSGETMTREKIEEMLDKLDERFANGEISEQVYLTLQAKWQNRLERLS